MVSPIPPVHLLTALGSSFFRIGGKVKALSLPDGVGSASGAALRKAWHSPMLGLAGLHPEWRQPVCPIARRGSYRVIILLFFLHTEMFI